MKLSDCWFSTVAYSDDDRLIIITGRDAIDLFRTSGKFPERVEVKWAYTSDKSGMPPIEIAGMMEAVELALRAKMEKDKLAILTGIYTGAGEKVWAFYTRSTSVFSEYLNQALESFEELPIVLSAEQDPEWEDYLEVYSLRDEEEEEE